MTPATRPRRFPVDAETMLVLSPVGATGAHAIACLLGLRTMPHNWDTAVYDREEWGDILAKLRGMQLAGLVYSWPIYRAHCGCGLHAREDARTEPLAPGCMVRVAEVAIRYCAGHMPLAAGQVQVPSYAIGWIERRL